MTFTYDLEMWFNIPAHPIPKKLFVKYEGNRAKGESQVYIYMLLTKCFALPDMTLILDLETSHKVTHTFYQRQYE